QGSPMRFIPIALALLATGCSATTVSQLPDSPLISRGAIFGNPERISGQVSPDGKYISFLAPRDGVLNVWVVERGLPLSSARPLTHEKTRPIRNYGWASNSQDILYTQDKGGDENFLLYAVTPATGAERTLTDFQHVRVQIFGGSLKRPDELVVG